MIGTMDTGSYPIVREPAIWTHAGERASPIPGKTPAPGERRESGTPGIAWANHVRCLFVASIIAMLAFVLWRPGIGSFLLSLSMTTPPYGERIAWTAKDGPPPRLAPRKTTQPPDEWRLKATAFPFWNAEKQESRTSETANRLNMPADWRRFTSNPWNWREKTVAGPSRNNEPPPQRDAPAASGRDSAMPPPAAPNVVLPETPRLPAAEPAAGTSGAGAPDRSAGGALSLPPETGPDSGSAKIASGTAGAPERKDWEKTEITAPIPGAYLMIYPRLKFVGLCVPGEGYVRKYHKAGVPRNPSGGKTAADDGRVPYGNYYVAFRDRDATGPSLYLSWPSPEDGRRLNLDSSRQAEIEAAWKNKALPPQDTAAGGGVGINGLRGLVGETDGGFSLEPEQMEEVFAALADGAWVLIKE